MDEDHEGLEKVDYAAPPRCSNVDVCALNLVNEKELEKMKGDAIGDTLYSESAVLRTLMSLSQVFLVLLLLL